MPVSKEAAITTTEDEESEENCQDSFNVKVNGGNGNFAIGKKVKLVTARCQVGETLTASKFFENFDAFLPVVTASRGPEKDRIECFVLKEILPFIESHSSKNGGSGYDTLEALARLSLPKLRSPRITKHALKLLDKLVSMDIANGVTNAHAVETEKCLRQPIVDGSFRSELTHDQRRRLEVYCNFLVALIIGRAREHLAYPYKRPDKVEIGLCKSETEKILRQWPLPNKDRKRLCLEVISSLLERLLNKTQRHRRLKELLDSCEGMLKDDFVEKDVDCLLDHINHLEDGTVDLFIILKMLHAKVNVESKAYKLLKCITVRHLFSPSWSSKRERHDWYFALLACQIFVDVTKNHNSKATRVDAANSLEHFCATRACQKSVIMSAIVMKYVGKATFAYDAESRKSLLGKLHQDDLREKISLELLIKRICALNRKGFLEVSPNKICENDKHVIMRGRYDDKPVAIKVVSSPVSRLLDPHDCLVPHLERLMENEIAVRKYLCSEKNHSVPLMISDTTDTNKLPYHFVMEHSENGDLRSYLLRRREKDPPSYKQALQICLGSAKAMEFVHKKHVVHNQLRAEHLLVGQDHQCIKITGFGLSRRIPKAKVFKEGYKGECLGPNNPSIRWTPPWGLQDPPLCSSLSDIWAFGVLMYEIVTCGGLPYAEKSLEKVREDVSCGRYLSKEQHMKDGYYSLMQRCFSEDSISFTEICSELQKLINQCDDKDDRPMRIPENIGTVYTAPDDFESQNEAADGKAFTPHEQPKTGIKKKQTSLIESSAHHGNKLIQLNHPHLVKIFKVQKKTVTVKAIVHEHYPKARLGEHLKNHTYNADELSRFCAQICSALNYLHSQDIVHCNLTPDNVVVVNRRYVKLAGLENTRSLHHFDASGNISICTRGHVDAGQYRWHAPEVIQEGVHSKESDVWSLGILMWTIFSSLDADSNSSDFQPLPLYEDSEVLQKLKDGVRPRQTSKCPDWLYIVMTQCWLLHTCERASSMAILECLTHRTPWESYVLQTWHRKHSEDVCENWPTLSITQRCADEFILPSRKEVIESTSEEFSDHHSYDYFPSSFTKVLRNAGRRIKSVLGMATSPPRSQIASSSSLPTLTSSSNQMSGTSMERQSLSRSSLSSCVASSSDSLNTSSSLLELPVVETYESVDADNYENSLNVDEIYGEILPSAPPEELQSLTSLSSLPFTQESLHLTPVSLRDQDEPVPKQEKVQYSQIPALDYPYLPSAPPEEDDFSDSNEKFNGMTDYAGIWEANPDSYEPIVSKCSMTDAYMPFYKTPPSTLTRKVDKRDTNVVQSQPQNLPVDKVIESSTLPQQITSPIYSDTRYDDVLNTSEENDDQLMKSHMETLALSTPSTILLQDNEDSERHYLNEPVVVGGCYSTNVEMNISDAVPLPNIEPNQEDEEEHSEREEIHV